jgi:hypothetical protein
VGQVLRSGLAPAAVEFMDRATLACVREMLPFTLPPQVRALLLFMVDGHPRDVADRVKRLHQMCKKPAPTRCCRPKTKPKPNGCGPPGGPFPLPPSRCGPTR